MIELHEAQRIFDQFGILTNFGGNGLGVSQLADALASIANPILALDDDSQIPTYQELARICLYIPSFFDSMKKSYVERVMSTKPASEENWRTIFLCKNGDDDWQYRIAGVSMHWTPNELTFPRPPWSLDDVITRAKGVPEFIDRQAISNLGISTVTADDDQKCAVCQGPVGHHSSSASGLWLCSEMHALIWAGHLASQLPTEEIELVRALDNHTLIVVSKNEDGRTFRPTWLIFSDETPPSYKVILDLPGIGYGELFPKGKSVITTILPEGNTVVSSPLSYGRVTLTI